ncbi:Histone H2B.11 [Acorus gramineus]|uniref:Histone H2B.11 n=1 Tax=Acorus gramineus TaxID=55184 RepID=A0AAV9AT89_ACOGR|nr:Histone H2B.11 [Acorus gramineus]
MTVINGLVNDMFERMAEEAARLSKHARKVTMTSREIQGAVRECVSSCLVSSGGTRCLRGPRPSRFTWPRIGTGESEIDQSFFFFFEMIQSMLDLINT